MLFFKYKVEKYAYQSVESMKIWNTLKNIVIQSDYAKITPVYQ